jgi:hypothetical protein
MVTSIGTAKKIKSLKEQIRPFVTLSLKKTGRSSLFVSDLKKNSSLKKNIDNIYLKESA